jgi:hypothetical protein
MRGPLTLAVLCGLSLCLVPRAALAQDAAPSESAQALLCEAQASFDEDAYGTAAGKLREALVEAPDWVPALQWLAVASHAQGKLDDALDAYWAIERLSWSELPADADEAQVRERELLVQCEGLIALLVNEERKRRDLPLLLPDPQLCRIARGHSDEMRDRGYFDHKSPTPALRTPTLRFLAVFGDLPSYAVGENIARRYGTQYSLTPEAANVTHEEWMESKGHRDNIVSKAYRCLGVGLSVNERGDYWATQVFAAW